MDQIKPEKQTTVFRFGILHTQQCGGMSNWRSGGVKRANNKVSQIIMSEIERHSKKPNEARERIVELMGDLPRIELFARDTFPGWDAYGNEI